MTVAVEIGGRETMWGRAAQRASAAREVNLCMRSDAHRVRRREVRQMTGVVPRRDIREEDELATRFAVTE